MKWFMVIGSCCSSAGDPRKNSAPLFAAFRTNLSSPRRFHWHAGKLLFQSFPNWGCSRNKLHAFHHEWNSHRWLLYVSDYLLSLLLNQQEVGVPQHCAPGGTSPNVMWAWFYSFALLWLFRLGTTDHQWLNTLQFSQIYMKLLGTWHILVWKLVSLVITNRRKHPAVCQRWRPRREKRSQVHVAGQKCSQRRIDVGSLALGLKNCFHFVNQFVPFLQFFHYFFV